MLIATWIEGKHIASHIGQKQDRPDEEATVSLLTSTQWLSQHSACAAMFSGMQECQRLPRTD